MKLFRKPFEYNKLAQAFNGQYQMLQDLLSNPDAANFEEDLFMLTLFRRGWYTMSVLSNSHCYALFCYSGCIITLFKHLVMASRISSASVSPRPSAVHDDINELVLDETNWIVTSIV